MKKDDIFNMLRRAGNIVYEQCQQIQAQLNKLLEVQETQTKQKAKELNARDRVDISLKDYEELKNIISHYENDISKYMEIFKKLGIEKFVDKITPEAIAKTQIMFNPITQEEIYTISFTIKPQLFEHNAYNNNKSNKRRF